MLVIPAIDLKSGQCVRLVRGDLSTASVFNDSPAGQAKAFETAGCSRIHVVDLDGAFSGRPENAGAVDSILQSVGAEVQLGGGIRDLKTIEIWLDKGVNQVILGTAAVENRELVRAAAKEYPGRIIVGLDARNGFASTRGWAETSSLRATELAMELEGLGIAAIVFTDISTDGMMAGPNFDAVSEMSSAVNVPVIASGGISSMDDLRQLAALEPRLHGAVVGRAIYEGAVDLAAAVSEVSAD